MSEQMGNTYIPDYLVTPGEVLADYIEAYSMKQSELAARLGSCKKTINEIVKGKAPITPDTSLKLEKVFSRPAHFWNNLELQYQEDKARLKESERIKEHLVWLKQVPIAPMIKLGFIEKKKDITEQLVEVLRFFGVASPEGWKRVWEKYQVAYRQSQRYAPCAESVSAWLRQGEILAQQMQCQPFDKQEFKSILMEVRSLTRVTPEIFQPQVSNLCAKAGVAVVFVPDLPKTGVSGATRWIKDKAVIQLSLRYKSDDQLWFTFFHEAGHILKHGRKEVFLEGNGMGGEKEEEANEFARETLIPSQEYRNFLMNWDGITHSPIKEFADEIGIAPGVIVGRLQFDKFLLPSHGNRLKVFYEWKKS